MEKTATLTVGGQEYQLPVYEGTTGPSVIDVSSLAGQGIFTFDPGFTSTAACNSEITYIDGDNGILLYRGYPIYELATRCDFLEICHLLLNKELPNKQKKEEFVHNITYHTMIHEQLMHFFRGFRRDAHPMAIMVGVVGALSAFYHEKFDSHDHDGQLQIAYRLIAKMPTIAAMCYKYVVGQPFVFPRNDLSYAGNFLYMM